MANETGMCPHDIAATLQKLNMIERNPETGKFKVVQTADSSDLQSAFGSTVNPGSNYVLAYMTALHMLN